MNALSELRAIFDGLHEIASYPAKPVTADDIAQTRRNIRELTKAGEHEIQEVVFVVHARPPPIAQLHAAHKTDPALTIAEDMPVYA
jgi:hypothetical protein